MRLKILLLTLFFISLGSLANLEDKPAITFTLPELASEQTVSLEQLKGKVVYLDFWASWCKPCAKSFPALDKLYGKYKDQGFEVVAINLDEKRKNATAFLQTHPVSYTVLYDKGATMAQQYNVQTMPSAYFIDKKGIVRLVHQGFREDEIEKIDQAIQFLLAE